MPRFNAALAVTPQIGYWWFDQSRFVLQDCASGTCVIRLSDGTPQAPRGCNNLIASGSGHWAAWLGGNPAYGVFDSFGRVFQASGLGGGDMGPTGEYPIKLVYFSYGPWDVIEADGTRWALTGDPNNRTPDGSQQGHDATNVQLFGNRKFLYRNPAGGSLVTNLPFANLPSGPVWWPRGVYTGTQWTLLYQRPSDSALVLDGVQIAPPGEYFYPDLAWDGTAYHVTWSTSQADTNAQFATFTPAQLNLLRAPAPVQAPITVAVISAHPRKLWVAPYYSFGTHGDSTVSDFLTYGNAATLVGDMRDPTVVSQEMARVLPLGLPMIVAATSQPVAPYLGSIVAWLVSGGALTDLAGSVPTAAALPEKPVIAYLDAPEQWPTSRPAWLTDRVWPAVQAYRKAGESVGDFAARMNGLMTRCAAYGSYCVLTPRWDDVNGTQPVSFTTDCMAVYADLIQRFPVCGVMPFADRRGTGISENADLKGWAQAFARANVARPNRFDYWTPSTSDMATVLRNKLGQSVEMVVLSAAEKAYLAGKL